MPLTPEQLERLTIKQYTQRCKVDKAGERLAAADHVVVELGIVNQKTIEEHSDAYQEYVRARSGKK